jgi:hypothetical protein
MQWKPWKLARYRIMRRLRARRREVKLAIVTESAAGLIRGRLIGPAGRELAVADGVERGRVVEQMQRAARWAGRAHNWAVEVVDVGDI